jgi:DnaK suppressor protein
MAMPKKKAAAKKRVTKQSASGKTSKTRAVGRAGKKKAAPKTLAKRATKKKSPIKKATKKKSSKKKAITTKAKANKSAASKSTKKKTGAKRAATKKTVSKKKPTKKADGRNSASTKKVAKKKAVPKKKTSSIKRKAVASATISSKKPPAIRAPSLSKKTTTAVRRPTKKKVSSTTTTRPAARGKANLLSGPVAGFKPYEAKRTEGYMNDAQLEHFRELLSSWKRELMEEVDRTMHHMKDDASNPPDPNDRATQETEFGLELRTRDRERKLLKKIDAALHRIDDGSFGYCDETGEEIGLRRLEARPVATMCVEAQERRELAERQFRDREDYYR